MADASRPIPLQSAQHRKLSLGVHEGVDGYRLAFSAESCWAPVTDPNAPHPTTLHFPTADDAWRARAAALEASARLNALFAAARGGAG